MTIYAVIFAVCAIVLFVCASYQSNRAANLAILLDEQRAYAAKLHRRLARARTSLHRHAEAAACYVEHTEALEKRAAWLEARRAVILQRWWKRKAYRRLSAWRVAGGGR